MDQAAASLGETTRQKKPAPCESGDHTRKRLHYERGRPELEDTILLMQASRDLFGPRHT